MQKEAILVTVGLSERCIYRVQRLCGVRGGGDDFPYFTGPSGPVCHLIGLKEILKHLVQ